MNKEIRTTIRIATLAIFLIVLLMITVICSTGCVSMTGRYHTWRNDVMQTADRTRYETRKQIEDTCRATIVSYESDKLIWEQYKDSVDSEQRGWAESAKIRANKAALTYNEYFLKNNYVFEDNVPPDIQTELPIIK